MKIKTLALTAVLAVSALAYADETKVKPETAEKMKPGAAKLTDVEMKIIAHQNHMNMMEVDISKYTQKNGAATAVKDYAKMAAADHQKANSDLTAFAKKRGMSKIPKDMPATEEAKRMHDEAMSAMGKLKKMKGAELDRAYLSMMIQDHDRELANLDTVLGEIQDPDLKTLLEGTRPVLQRHADNARELQKLSEQTSSIEKDMRKDVSKDKSKDQPAAP